MRHHEEENLQIACARWFAFVHPKLEPLLHHSPNGGRRDVVEGAKFKKMGTRKGFPDFILLVPNSKYGSFGIEMKTPKGRQSPDQKRFQEVFEKAGNKYVICRSLDEFRHEIDDYLTNCVAPENARSEGRDAHF